MRSRLILCAFFLFEATSAAEAPIQVQWRNQLKVIGLGIHAYHDIFKEFPRDICDSNGKPILSWRVRLLPFIEQQALYQGFRLDEPWDSPHNLPLSKFAPSIYQSPYYPHFNNSLICFMRGPQTVLGDGQERRGLQDKSFALIVEVDPAHSVVWSQPDEWRFDPTDPAKGLGIVPGRWRSWLLMSDASVQAIPIHLRPDELRSFFKGELVVEPRLNWRESLVRGPIAALTAPTFLYNVIAICWAFFIVCKLMAGGSASTGEGLVFILGAERLILLCVFIGSYEYAWNDLDFARPRSVPHGSYVFLPRLAAFGACLLWLWSPQGKGNGRAIFTGLAAWLALAIGITGLGNGWRRPVEEYFASAGSPFGLGLAAFGLLVWWTLSPRREKQPWAHGAGIFLAMLPCIWFAVWWWLGAVEPRWWYAELSGTR